MDSLIPLVNKLDVDAEQGESPPGPLPELSLQFFVPRLTEKPQNPIMDTLRMIRLPVEHKKPMEPVLPRLPDELQLLVEDVARFAQAKYDRLEDIWKLAVSDRERRRNQVLSWDALRPCHKPNVVPSPFLSEQSSDTFASARYHVRPPLNDPDVQLIYVHVEELFESLLLTISGTSSHLHIWNPISETFVLRKLNGKSQGELVIVGKDEIVSTSLLRRFLTIGNLMRRLELLSERQDRRFGPSMHAFNHAISSILAHLRQRAEAIAPNPDMVFGIDARLAALWVQYEDMEAMLTALAALCGRDESVTPSDYPLIPESATALLSIIYQHVADHLERSSPRIVTGALAFVLTMTSRSYFQSLCASVGYATPESQSMILRGRATQRNGHPWLQSGGMLDEVPAVQQQEPEDVLDDEYPDFIGAEVKELLSRARKSLLLLRAADPDHALLTGTHIHRDIEWLWTDEQIHSLIDGLVLDVPSLRQQSSKPLSHGVVRAAAQSQILQAFKVFDLPPGESQSKHQHDAAVSILSGSNTTSPVRSFLESFPHTLPSSAPTLAHLTRHILNPLVAHAASLSGALVTRLLSPATPFHLHTHLVLLRGYLLLTSHAFKARLQDSLFTDAEEVSVPVVGSRTYAPREVRENVLRERHRSRTESGRSRSRAASGSQSAKAKTQIPGRRALGLSPALTVGDRWPPGGTDLNFHLRTVIVDSLDDGQLHGVADVDEEVDEVEKARKKILEEGEWRLGFAIRDLGTGREKWLNPLSIEALDFLYLQYQPPHPLDVVITPAVLSKYHRMFAFNLRLMRVENVVRTLFRLTRKAATPLFPTITPSDKLLLRCRFVAHGFIMGLSSYVYDIAIGSHMDAFLARLSAASGSALPNLTESNGLSASTSRLTAYERQSAVFADVFELADQHSRVLDDVLSSCLLRSGQKAVGDVLRQCMELVLELGILAGDLKDGRLEEYEAAPALEELWGKFRAKMTTFVKVLKALVGKEADASGVVMSDIPLHMMQAHRNVSGTTANLHQLLLRLNMSGWWTKPTSSERAY